jgi:hypothetical protein
VEHSGVGPAVAALSLATGGPRRNGPGQTAPMWPSSSSTSCRRCSSVLAVSKYPPVPDLRSIHFNLCPVTTGHEGGHRGPPARVSLLGSGLGGPSTRAEVVEAFVVAGLAGRASSIRDTYRSVLRALSAGPRPELATPFPGSAAPSPYGAAEQAELFSWACAQPTAWRRSGALAMVALGTGAELRAAMWPSARGR